MNLLKIVSHKASKGLPELYLNQHIISLYIKRAFFRGFIIYSSILSLAKSKIINLFHLRLASMNLNSYVPNVLRRNLGQSMFVLLYHQILSVKHLMMRCCLPISADLINQFRVTTIEKMPRVRQERYPERYLDRFPGKE